MLADECIVGAVFIGGMEGIPDEHALVGRIAPKAPRFALKAPGGAAATLEASPALMATPLDLNSRRYPVLARGIADAIGL
jgi:SLOG cluster3 family